MAYALKLAPIWAFSDYENKHKLQNPVFPSGMTYNREKDACRTSRINSVFAYMKILARALENEKPATRHKSSELPVWWKEAARCRTFSRRICDFLSLCDPAAHHSATD